MPAPEVFCYDMETHPIVGNNIPRAVGLAYKFPGEAPAYLAWGHATGNNATESAAREVLQRALDSGLPWLAHGGKFDMAVLWMQFQIDLPKHREFHDTSFLAFLADPHAFSYELKQLAKRFINMPPDEKDDMAAWVWEHRVQLFETTGRKVNRRQGKDNFGRVLASNTMEFMPQIPGDMAGRYAVGDIVRTARLFPCLWDYVIDQSSMGVPYNRELQLQPILMENERLGIRVALEDLERDTETYERALEFVEDQLRSRLSAPGLNFDADQDFAHALISAGIVGENQFERTPSKGEFRVGKDSLKPSMFSDPNVASAIGYRNRLKTCLTMFMQPWLEQAKRNGGHVSTNWNQTRGGDGGTRTGRPSTTDPNFLNISKNFEGRHDGYVHPEFLGVPKLPLVRKYMLPDHGGVWAHRDFDGQEMRVFAHYEEGELLAQFLADPDRDPHQFIAENMVRATGDERWGGDGFRTHVKNINFGKLYGAGVPRIQSVMGNTYDEAKKLSTMHDKALPGRKKLSDLLEAIARTGAPIKTWGGRLYFAEEPRYVKGRFMEWFYKLLNYLVQGSAADITKQSLIDWHNHPDRDPFSRFLVTVYDEINLSIPQELIVPQMGILKTVMNEDRLDCPMRSTAKIGPSWGDAVKVKD